MRSGPRLAAPLLIVGCVAVPSAHADESIGPGSYAVPGRVPHGIYVAQPDPRDNPPSCSFSTWTSDDKFINGDSGSPARAVVADLSAPAVAKFITHGCTPWSRVH